MSTIQVINAKHPSSATNNIVTDASGNVSMGGTLAVTGTLTVGGSAVFALASGTVMLFAQTAAPTGFTKLTTHNNKALRVVSGAASSGGTVAFTTAFASQAVSGTVGNTTLSTTQIPSHTHSVPGGGGSNTVGNGCSTAAGTGGQTTGAAGGGGAHNHSFTGTAIDLAVQYVDVILASKD